MHHRESQGVSLATEKLQHLLSGNISITSGSPARTDVASASPSVRPQPSPLCWAPRHKVTTPASPRSIRRCRRWMERLQIERAKKNGREREMAIKRTGTGCVSTDPLQRLAPLSYCCYVRQVFGESHGTHTSHINEYTFTCTIIMGFWQNCD